MQLRPFKEKDAFGMLEWMQNPQVNQYFSADFKTYTLENILKFIQDSAKDTVNFHRACVDDNDCYLGSVSLKNINHAAQNAEYAISFLPKAHGTGAAFFATNQILHQAFSVHSLEKVYLCVSTQNERANHFYRKFGFIYEGTFKKHMLIHGKLHDINWFCMLREEWEKR